MIGRRLLLVLALVMGAAFALGPGPARAAPELPGAPVAVAGAQSASRRVMMMLDLGAEHYRSGSDYGGDYGDAMGIKARLRFARKVARAHRLALVDSWPMPLIGVDCIIFEIRDGRTVEAVVRELSAVPGVSWSQPLNEFEMLEARPPGPARAATVSYNDRLFSAQPAASLWHLARLHAVATGRGVTVAVIDSRVDLLHPDLAGQFAGSVDFVPGRPQAERHGTGVAGIIAARSNNAQGIAGVAPDARILALRACWERATGGVTVCDSLTLARALTYAIDHGAGVVNLSLTGPRDPLIARLVALASARGATVVAAVDQKDPAASFPAFLPGVVAVGDERLSDRLQSAYKAPGLDVLTTQPEGKWDLVSGSSYAAAHVSGLVALLRQLSGRRTAPETLLGPHGTLDACAALARVSHLDRRACLR
ncbi:S8 family serine peptidase [Novosphingobium bradum]|uniref:S8 family serine peptidase n=1 Tax=Novosphingobium bradum TaxID=1737444 RepID=A0ABV7IS36_9SPHN